MLSTLAAILIALFGGLLGLIYVWAKFPQIPDFRQHPVILAIKMWLGRCQNIAATETDAALPPIQQLHCRIRSLAKIIHAPGEFIPTDTGADFGWAQLEYDGKFRYFYVERGEHYDIRMSSDIDEVLYWVFSDITWAMASNHELIHRDPRAGDIRRILFSYQLKLLSRLKTEWADRRRAKIDEILLANPFLNDRAGEND